MANPDDFIIPVEPSAKLIERNRETDWPDLSHQKKAFAFEYLANGYKHREAAQTVGIAQASAIRLLRDPLVSAFISHIQQEHFTSQIITKQFVEQQYLELIPKLKGEEEIPIVTGSGAAIEARKFHGSELAGVLRDLSKVTGYVEEEEGNKKLVQVVLNFGAVMSEPEKAINGKRLDVEDN